MEIEEFMIEERGSAIIDGKNESFRADGYQNMLNKYGTKQDNSTAYEYAPESFADDFTLTTMYEGNGLFTKIIDRPAEEAVKHGLDIDFGDEDVAEYIEERLDELDFEEKFATAEKWARLYGGSIIVMIIDDGRRLEEPVNWKDVRKIEEMRVFERAVVQENTTSLYNFNFEDSIGTNTVFGEPELYNVFSIYGYFTVHRSRCLIFRNGRLPEQTTNSIYRYWGIPEYVKIKRALRECITSHEDGVKLMERSVQAIYKMKNLANLLSTDDGEDKVIQRLQVIDMARGIINSIAIDNDGEDYDYKNFSTAGVKDIIDATCNMLSAVTDIPQTILFGRSPAGENSTGQSDFENYYNMVENIQKKNMKSNVRTLIDLIIKQGVFEGHLNEEPKYKVKFAPLWSLSEAEQANVEATKASTEATKAGTLSTYMQMNVLDPSEVRKMLANSEEYDIEEELPDSLNLPDDTLDLEAEKSNENSPQINAENEERSKAEAKNMTDIEKLEELDDEKSEEKQKIEPVFNESEEKIKEELKKDAFFERELDKKDCRFDDADDTDKGVGVIIVKDGKVLCAVRENGQLCGPGGRIKQGETAEEAAIRETQEEFGILPKNLKEIGTLGGNDNYLPSTLFLTEDFVGEPKTDDYEMFMPLWMGLPMLMKHNLFPAFEDSIPSFVSYLVRRRLDGGPGSGYFNHPGGEGGEGNPGGSVSESEHAENIGLEVEELRRLKAYVSSWAYVVNDKLRNKSFDEIDDDEKTRIKTMDSALKKMPKYEGTIVRNLSFSTQEKMDEFVASCEVGKVREFPEYMSFSNMDGYNEDPDVIIYCADSKKGRDMQQVRADEGEVLYERNQRFLVAEKVETDGKVYLLFEEDDSDGIQG